jgi:hypothetical protein
MFNSILLILVVGLAAGAALVLIFSKNPSWRSTSSTYLATFLAVVIAIPFTIWIEDKRDREHKTEDETELLCAVIRTINTNEMVLQALSTAINEGLVTFDNLDPAFLQSVASLTYTSVTNKDVKWFIDDFRYRLTSLQRKLDIQQDLTGSYMSPEGARAFNENRKIILRDIKSEVAAVLSNITSFRNRVKINYPELSCPPLSYLPKP